MKLRALIIDANVIARIKKACEKARAKTVPWSTLRKYVLDDTDVVKLEDRKPGTEEVIGRAETVLIPRGYQASISFEEQPAGIIRHLSVSVDTRGKMPSLVAVDAILDAFGFEPLKAGTSRIWIEEFAPGHEAVNVVQVDSERKAGNA